MDNEWWLRCWFIILWIVPMSMKVATLPPSKGEESLITRIAFGSCANQSAPQPIWNAIVNFDPQIFIWLGDSIYGDVRRPAALFGRERTVGPWKNVPRFSASSEQEMASHYQKAKTSPGYSRLQKFAKIIGTWDDHDYGLNDAGKEFGGKVINQKLFLDFLDEPEDSSRREQKGVYASYMFGPVGRHIKVILLDTRFHRDPLHSDGSILGSSQWAWLKEELFGPKSAITIIGSSVQVISNLSATTGPLFYLESWGRFPRERERLFNLIADRRPNFGAVQIDWGATPPALNLEVRDVGGSPVSAVHTTLRELQPSGARPAASTRSAGYHRHCSPETHLPWLVRRRLALLVYGATLVSVLAVTFITLSAISYGRPRLNKFKLH